MRDRARRFGLVLVLVGAGVACVPSTTSRESSVASASPQSERSAVPTLQSTPTGPTPSLTFVRPTATPLPTFFPYFVRTGDSLTSIARQFRTTPRSIAYWNRHTYPTLDPDSDAYDPNNIRVGWTLLLRPGVEVDEELLTPLPSVAPASAVPASDIPASPASGG